MNAWRPITVTACSGATRRGGTLSSISTYAACEVGRFTRTIDYYQVVNRKADKTIENILLEPGTDVHIVSISEQGQIEIYAMADIHGKRLSAIGTHNLQSERLLECQL